MKPSRPAGETSPYGKQGGVFWSTDTHQSQGMPQQVRTSVLASKARSLDTVTRAASTSAHSSCDFQWEELATEVAHIVVRQEQIGRAAAAVAAAMPSTASQESMQISRTVAATPATGRYTLLAQQELLDTLSICILTRTGPCLFPQEPGLRMQVPTRDSETDISNTSLIIFIRLIVSRTDSCQALSDKCHEGIGYFGRSTFPGE